MSLRMFHIVFITASVLLSVMLGVWGFQHNSPVLGVLSFVGTAALIVYRGKFLKLAKRAGLTVVLIGLFADSAFACPVCFGPTDSPVADGVNMAIFALLGVTGTVLGAFVAFFVHLARRARQIREQEWAHDALSNGL